MQGHVGDWAARRRARIGALLTAVVGIMALFGAGTAAADVAPFEIDEYVRDVGVSPQQAEEALSVQADGSNGLVVDRLEAGLGGEYAGVWFDNSSGEFVVPLVDAADEARAGAQLARADVDAADFRIVPAAFSWEELEAAQDQIDGELEALFEADAVETSLDASSNAVAITLADWAGSSERALVQAVAARSPVAVEVKTAEADTLGMQLEACNFNATTPLLFCDPPMRGGVLIEANGGSSQPTGAGCSAGFKAIGNSNGARYVLTAGHCVANVSEWESFTSSGQPKYLGQRAGWSYPVHDWAAIGVNGTYWDTSPWPSEAAYMGHVIEGQSGVTAPFDPDWAITGEGSSFQGQYVCHTGQKSGTSCGFVSGMGLTKPVDGTPYSITNLTRFGPVCAITGDSGGAVFASHTAVGIFNGSDKPQNESEYCKKTSYYTEVTEATAALNVSVGKRAPKVTISTSPLNGNPGWVTLRGEVTAPGATISNKIVEIELFKWNANSSKWELKTTPPLKATVNNNKYEIPNYNGVGPGGWLAKAVFPAQEPFAKATSNEVTEGGFEIKDGYRLKARHSGRCLEVGGGNLENGARLNQWDCLSPSAYQHQVFTVAPIGDGYYRLIARHSGRCVDVIDALTGDGVRLQQWSCNGFAQQSWLPKQVASVYNNFVAKHSGRCMEVLGGLTGNGAEVQQWGCGAGLHQQWEFQSVDSAAIPTFTTATVPPNEVLPGEYGYATVYGHVKAGAYGFGGQKVQVRYDKWNGSYWELRSTTEPTINSEGRFEYKYQGLGYGEWRVYVEYPGAANFAYSKSGYHNFHIGRGYRLIARHSKKCMSVSNNDPYNGTAIIQWDCSPAPNAMDGQVFTLVPFENGNYFEILINSHSTPQQGKCVDVAGGSTANAALLHQWDCSNGVAANQLWRPVEINGENWFAFLAKHSSKCADVGGESTANGMHVHQWDCHWRGNQQWQKQEFG